MTADAATPDASRRAVLAAGAAAVASTGITGCLDGGGGVASGEESPTAVASFFTFYDFARRIAADTPLTVENLVPVGMHGHGWEPDPSITRDIIDADVFVHVGEDFQPWADRAIQTVHDDDAGTHLVNARAGVDLVPLAESLDRDEEGVGTGRGRDPHFWLDPLRAQRAVENVATGFAAVFPEHAETFAANAKSVTDELAAVDDEWTAIFDAADRDVVFLAAHNAFAYLSDRYGATIEPLVTNLAATDDVRPEDMRRAYRRIADENIRYMGAAIFEPRRPARQLLAETDVEAYFPVTPYAGTTREWADRGWGYFEIARNINMPTFEIVLGAADPADTGLGPEWRNFA